MTEMFPDGSPEHEVRRLRARVAELAVRYEQAAADRDLTAAERDMWSIICLAISCQWFLVASGTVSFGSLWPVTFACSGWVGYRLRARLQFDRGRGRR